jgi:hypothetical protein
MKAAILLALATALPLSAATLSISPATPKAGDSVVVTVHDRGGVCPSTATSAKLVGQTLQVDVVTTPGGCLLGCPTADVPVAYVAPAVTLPAAGGYTIEYAFTDCGGKRTVLATQPLFVPPSCAFDRSLTVSPTTTRALLFSWCDPSYSPFPDVGQFATAYRIFVVRTGEAPILVQQQSSGTSASVVLTDHEAGAKSAFVEAVMCNVTVAGCRDSFTIKSNVVPLDVAPFDNCSFGGAALCLDGRFSVTARYHTAAGSSPANAVPMTKDSGYFWFFGKDNAEVTVKIVDACSLSSTFWFFAAGMTDVGVDLTVLDTHTGVVRRYSTPAGKAFVPIQDTGAFACP